MPAFALGLFDAIKFTETMVVFSNLPYRDDGYIYRAGNGSAAVEYRDLWCRPASGTFVVTMGGDPWGGSGGTFPPLFF